MYNRVCVCTNVGERPLNLRVTGQRGGASDGDTPLGKQLANELKRHHQASVESKAAAATGVCVCACVQKHNTHATAVLHVKKKKLLHFKKKKKNVVKVLND